MNPSSVRWVFSLLDSRSHALTDTDDESAAFLMARCGHCLPRCVQSSAARHGKLCVSCAAIVIGPPRFGRT